MSTKPRFVKPHPIMTPGPLKWSRSPDGITVEQLSGNILTSPYYVRLTFKPLLCSDAAMSDDINDVLKPELVIINAHPTPEQRELAAVRLGDYLSKQLRDFQCVMAGVMTIAVQSEPARVLIDVK